MWYSDYPKKREGAQLASGALSVVRVGGARRATSRRGFTSLPIGFGDRPFVDHHQRRRSRAHRDGEVGSGDLPDVDLDHGITGNPSALAGALRDPPLPLPQGQDVALEPVGHGLIDKGGADDVGDYPIEVGLSFDCVRERRIVDISLKR